jgi:hypothetical protein
VFREIAMGGLFADVVFLVVAMALVVSGNAWLAAGPLWLLLSSGTGVMGFDLSSSYKPPAGRTAERLRCGIVPRRGRMSAAVPKTICAVPQATSMRECDMERAATGIVCACPTTGKNRIHHYLFGP